MHHLRVISYKLNSQSNAERESVFSSWNIEDSDLQQLQHKSFFFFRFLVNFFTLLSFMHSTFQDLRRYSRIPAFTIWGVPICI